VLICSRKVVSSSKSGKFGSYNTSIFIDFKPCPVNLLGGAVTVGRLISCIEGNQATTRINNNIDEYYYLLFEENILKCFTWHSKKGGCAIYDEHTGKLIMFSNFTSHDSEIFDSLLWMTSLQALKPLKHTFSTSIKLF